MVDKDRFLMLEKLMMKEKDREKDAKRSTDT
jgi:hypothetical protein